MNSIYSVMRDRWNFLHDFYCGGVAVENPSSRLADQSLYSNQEFYDSDGIRSIRPVQTGHRRSYLVPFPAESNLDFDRRNKLAVYINFPATIVDAYADSITPNINRELGSLEQLLTNLDGQGMGWSTLVDDVARWTAAYGMLVTVADASDKGEFRVITVHPSSIAWIALDESGSLIEFAYREVRVETVGRGRYRPVFWVWDKNNWYKYDGDVSELDNPISYRDQLKLVKSGPHGTPGRVPVAFSYFKRDTACPTPLGISAINDASRGAQLVYNLLSNIQSYHQDTSAFLALPTLERGGALPPKTELAAGLQNALPYPSEAGSPTWVSPPSEQANDARAHVAFIMSAVYRAAGMEVTADSSAQVQSGEALRIRSRGFEQTAKRFAANLRAWELNMLSLFATWAGVSDDPNVSYPDRYVLPDPAEELARSVVFAETFGKFVGPLGTVAMLRQAVNAAATLSDEDVAKVIKEAYEKMLQGSGNQEIYSYDYDASVLTLNEARANKGLPPLEGGDIPIGKWVEQQKTPSESKVINSD